MTLQGRIRQSMSRWADSGEAQARDLRKEHAIEGYTQIASAPDRQPVVLRGTLRTVTLMPRSGVPTLEADLDDGTGVITLVWLGRRQIAGISVGRSLSVSGRVGVHEGRRILYNPRYALVP